MGICINCADVIYSCEYTRWENFREEIANASIEYLKNEYNVLLENGATDSYLENQLSKLMDYIDVNNCKTTNDFIRLFLDENFLNLFIYYNMGGVFALLNKSDDGYYTIGNAIDMVQTFDFIQKYITDDVVTEQLHQVKKVFETSVDKKTIISIYYIYSTKLKR